MFSIYKINCFHKLFLLECQQYDYIYNWSLKMDFLMKRQACLTTLDNLSLSGFGLRHQSQSRFSTAFVEIQLCKEKKSFGMKTLISLQV